MYTHLTKAYMWGLCHCSNVFLLRRVGSSYVFLYFVDETNNPSFSRPTGGVHLQQAKPPYTITGNIIHSLTLFVCSLMSNVAEQHDTI